MFQVFDRFTFYTVTEDELDSRPASELVHITDGELDLNEYETWIQQNADNITAVAEQRSAAIAKFPFLKDLVQPYQPPGRNESTTLKGSGETVKAMMPGKVYKCAVKEGDGVAQGDILVS